MKVLVTGGAGYIGSHTCKLLAELGHVPVVFDNFSTGHRWLARYGPVVEGDIADKAAIVAALIDHAPDAVIHFAASAYVGESMRLPLRYFRNNVAGTLNLLEAMAETSVSKLVFSSSCATYGIPPAVPITEDMPQSPINPYGTSKLVGEQMMRAAADAGLLDCIALRYFNASGAEPSGEIGEFHQPETHIIPLILEAMNQSDRSFSVLGDDYDTADGSCVRDYLHVVDLARAHIAALDALDGQPAFRAFNLGTGNGHSVKEVIAAARNVTEGDLTVIIGERRPGDPPVLIAAPDKAREELGWTPMSSDLDTILKTAWEWMHAANHPQQRS